MTTMKAIRIHEFGGPEVLTYEDAPKPEAGADDVLVRVHAAGVNPVDWKFRQGLRSGLALPMIVGWDVAGVIEQLGDNVSTFKAGDQIYSMPARSRDGAYAEYIVIPKSEIAPKPKSLDFIHSAAVPLAALTAWQAIFDIAHLSKGQTILIHGASGGVGHFAVQFARWKGARTIGTATGDGVDFVYSLGADEVIDYKQTPFEAKVRDVDVVFDLIGGEAQQRSWGVIKSTGLLVSTVGIQSPEIAQEHGVRAEAMSVHPDAGELIQIAHLIDNGYVRPVVQAVFPLSEAAKAHEMLQRGGVRGKIVLKID